jgi:DNA polymerase III epsilon subunit-like protein
MNIMIDIETLGTTPGSLILSVGAVPFDERGVFTQDGFHMAISAASCTAAGLTIDPSTVAWWMRQSDAARAAAFPEVACTLGQVLYELQAWFARTQGERVWCHGATFDVPLLDAAYRAMSMTPPWAFYNVRCTRTLYELAGVSPDRTKGTHHNALDDAIAQAEAAMMAHQKLGIWPEVA